MYSCSRDPAACEQEQPAQPPAAGCPLGTASLFRMSAVPGLKAASNSLFFHSYTSHFTQGVWPEPGLKQYPHRAVRFPFPSQRRHRVALLRCHSSARGPGFALARIRPERPKGPRLGDRLLSFTVNRGRAGRCLGPISSGNDGNIAHCSSPGPASLL